MTKRLSSKFKVARSLGVNLWGSTKGPFARNRAYGPGQHGQHKGRLSDYGTQLKAKQKLKKYYGSVSEGQMRKYYFEAMRRRGDTSVNLIGLLESRLDALVYRLKIAPTVFSSRQIVSHGHIKVNGKRVNIPSYQVKAGDVISVADAAKEMPLILGSVADKSREVPGYLEFNDKALSATYTRVPTIDEVPYPVEMEPNLVIEYYSRMA